MAELVLISALLLAFVNGANDNMKGVATLYGSGALSYRKALGVATLSTALGCIASILVATALVRAFSAKGLIPDAALDARFLAAVGLSAALTVLSATRLGFPVSTTHALVGGLVGSGWVAAGSALNLGALGAIFVAPLLLGPVIALFLAWAGIRAGRSASQRLGVTSESCVCVGGEWLPAAEIRTVTTSGVIAGESLNRAVPRLSLSVGESPACRERYSGRIAQVEVDRVITLGHLISGSAVGFARGLNDTPKILGLVVGVAIVSAPVGTLAIAAAMAIGGLVAARRVTETMARKITTMTPGQGLVGNLATSLLVIAASPLGLPLSTTHVSIGGILGIGASTGKLRWPVVSQILLAWVTTVPVAAALAAGLMWGFQ